MRLPCSTLLPSLLLIACTSEAASDTDGATESGAASTESSGASASAGTSSGNSASGPQSTTNASSTGTSNSGSETTAAEGSSGSESGDETSGGPELPEGASADARFEAAAEVNVFDAAAHPDGGMLLVGNTLVGDNREGVVMHVDDDGTRLWSLSTAGLRNDQFFGVTTTADRVYAAGLTRTIDGGFGANDQILISEFELDGTYLRSVVYGNASREHAWGITALAGGGFAVAGITDASGIGDIDGFLMVLDADLDAVFTVGLGGPGGDILRTVHADGNGFVVGGSQAGAGDATLGLAARIAGDGSVDWSGTLDTGGFTQLRAGAVMDDGRNVLVGASAGFGAESSEGIVMVFDGDTPTVWTAGDIGADQFAGVVADGTSLTLLGSAGANMLEPWLARVNLGRGLESEFQFVYPAPRDQLARVISEPRRADGGLGFALASLGGPANALETLFTDSLGGVDEACVNRVAAAFPFNEQAATLSNDVLSVSLTFTRIDVAPPAFPLDVLEGTDGALCDE